MTNVVRDTLQSIAVAGCDSSSSTPINLNKLSQSVYTVKLHKFGFTVSFVPKNICQLTRSLKRGMLMASEANACISIRKHMPKIYSTALVRDILVSCCPARFAQNMPSNYG